jgi:phosphate-selective porin OprO/OprP
MGIDASLGLTTMLMPSLMLALGLASEPSPDSPPPEASPPAEITSPDEPASDPPSDASSPPDEAAQPPAPADEDPPAEASRVSLGAAASGSALAVPPPTPATAAPPASPFPLGPVPKRDASLRAEAPLDATKTKWRPGTGLEVKSADGRYSLQFGLFAQLLAAVVDAPNADPTLDVVFRRARIILGGNVFAPHILYKVQLTASPAELGWQGGTIRRSPILDWYFTFDRVRDATFVVGQYKVPYNHQRMLRVTGMQFVDRSGANNEFTMDRDIGADVRSKDVGGLGHLRYYVGAYLGNGIAIHGPSDPGLAYVGRVEVLPFGNYDDLEEADHDRSSKPRMLLGGAFAYIDRDPHENHAFGGKIPLDGGKTSTLNATADLQFRWAGASIESAFFWREATRRQSGGALDEMGNPIPTVAPRNGIAWFAQGGYLLPRLPFEVGARYGQIIAQGDANQTSLTDQDELGGVLNYYFARHLFKLQLDYLRLWSRDIGGGTNQVRLQLQAWF